jgi:hypothetical protein
VTKGLEFHLTSGPKIENRPHTLSPLAPSFTPLTDATDQSESTSTITDDRDDDGQVGDSPAESEADNEWFGYIFVGDNIDGKSTPRLMQSHNQSKEFHYFQVEVTYYMKQLLI